MTEPTQRPSDRANVAVGVVMLAVLVGAPIALLLGRTVFGLGELQPWEGLAYVCRGVSETHAIDIDRDGRQDRFTVREALPEPWDVTSSVDEMWDDRRGAWKFDECDVFYRVQLDDGDRVEQRAVDIGWVPVLAGPTDINRDGRPEMWLLGGESVDPVTFDRTGRVIEFHLDLSAGAAHSDPGVECTDLDGDHIPEVIQTLQDLPDPDTGKVSGYWSYSAWRFDGVRMHEFAHGSGEGLADRPSEIKWDSDGCYRS